ncbi:hypothetical protein BC835DRAFT_987326, partial [Cytidiella melzeri]
VESDSFKLQYDSYDVWTLASLDYSKHHYYITHPATNDKWSWVSKPGTKGENVKLTIYSRIWIITHVGDGQYKIAPVGEQQKYLFWTDVNATPGKSITLEKLKESDDKIHWRFRDVNEGDQGDNLTSVVMIQHVPSFTCAAASRAIPEGIDPNAVPFFVEPEGNREQNYYTWKLTKVDEDWLKRKAISNVNQIYEGSVTNKIVEHYYVIQNLGTGKYAWDAEPQEEHTPVFQSDLPSVWKITRVSDDHYTISPAGKKEEELFWSARGPVGKLNSICLEKPSGELHHWIIKAIQRDFVPQSEAT